MQITTDPAALAGSLCLGLPEPVAVQALEGDWPSDVRLVLGSLAAPLATIPLAVVGAVASATIPAATVAAAHAALDGRPVPVVLIAGAGAGLDQIAGGRLWWRQESWGTDEAQSLGSVVVGPAGPTAVSADAGNAAGLGSDGLIFVAQSTDVGAAPRGLFPVLQIDTGGVAITSKEVYVAGTYTITDVNQGVVHSGALQIRGRGNTTWEQVKKPYRLNLGTKTPLLGMTANQKNWALLANFLDASRLANAFAWELGYRMAGLEWTPEYRTVEVVLNGTYLGMYQLCDLVRVESGRVPGSAASGDTGLGVTGTWLLEFTNKEAEAEPGFRTALFNNWAIWDTPEVPTTAQAEWVQASIAALEAAIQVGDWATWTTLADPTSFADWALINELISNADSNFWSSCKLWRSRDTATLPGKWHLGPLWDQDLSLGIYSPTIDSPPTGWKTKTANWLDRLWSTDLQWRLLLQQRWQALMSALADMGGLGWLDATMASYARAWLDDQRKWNYVRFQAREVDYRKRWLTTRIAWLDAQIMADPVIAGSGYNTFTADFGATF